MTNSVLSLQSGFRKSKRRPFQASRLYLLFFLQIAFISCSPEPEIEIEIIRNVFSYQGHFFGAASEEFFRWPVSGSRAIIDWEGTSVEEGEFSLAIEDENGESLYSGRAVTGPPEKTVSDRGSPGEWKMSISYSRLKGYIQVSGMTVLD